MKMEYNIGDKVIVNQEEKSYDVLIIDKRPIGLGYNLYDGIGLFNRSIISFKDDCIESKILAGPCPKGDKGEKGISTL